MAQLDVTKHNMDVITLSPKQQVEAASCIEKLEPHGWSLTEAVDYCLKHVIPFNRVPTVAETADRMIQEAENAKRDIHHLKGMRCRLRPFVDRFGSQQLRIRDGLLRMPQSSIQRKMRVKVGQPQVAHDHEIERVLVVIEAASGDARNCRSSRLNQ